MPFGMIKRIAEDASGGTFSGVLWDLDTWKEFEFAAQSGLSEVNRLDVVEYTTQDGKATGLKPRAMVRVSDWNNQPADVQDAVKATLRATVNKPTQCDIIIKKF